MRILFVLHSPLNCNSAIQILHFGNRLVAQGCEVTLCGKGDPSLIRHVGEPDFECISFGELARLRSRWEREHGETLIVAWTPRERVGLATLE